MPKEEVGFLVKYLFEGQMGANVAARIDRRVDRLPGQDNLHLLDTAVARLSRLEDCRIIAIFLTSDSQTTPNTQ